MRRSSAPSSKGREKRLPTARDKKRIILVPSSDQSGDEESAPVKSRPSSSKTRTSSSKPLGPSRSHGTSKMGSAFSRSADVAASPSKKRPGTMDETLVEGKDYAMPSKRTRAVKNQLPAGQATLSLNKGTLGIQKNPAGLTSDKAIVISSDSSDDVPRLMKNLSLSPNKHPTAHPSSSQLQGSQADGRARGSRSTSVSTRASESPLKQGRRAPHKFGCDDRGWRPGQLTARELALPKQTSAVKREPSQRSTHLHSSPVHRPPVEQVVQRPQSNVLVPETLVSPVKRKLPQQQGSRKKEKPDLSSTNTSARGHAELDDGTQSPRTPRRDVVPESISYDASPTPTKPKAAKIGGPLQDRDPGQQLPPPQPHFPAAKDDMPKRKPSGKKGRLSDLMVMDDESYRPPPSKSSAQRKSSKSSSKSASSSIARNRPQRAVAQPGMYEIPQMSAPLDMWIRKPSTPESRLLSRPAHVSTPARAAEAAPPRAVPVPKATASKKSSRAIRRQRSGSSELSPAPETQVSRPLKRVESSLLSPAPPTPPAPASQHSAKDVTPARTPSRPRPSSQGGTSARASQRQHRTSHVLHAPKSPSPTESPALDDPVGFNDIDDVLAEYADFAVSPANSMVSLASRKSINNPRTPKRQRTGSRLSASPLASRRHLPTPARSSTNDVRPSSDVSQTNTPSKPHPGTSLTSEIWREHERELAGQVPSSEQARVQAEARIEKRRQADVLLEEMDEEDELDFNLQFFPEPQPESEEEPPEHVVATRRSTRGRPTRSKPSPSAEPDPEEVERLKLKQKVDAGFKQIIKEGDRDISRGLGVEALNAAMAAVNDPHRSPGGSARAGNKVQGLELDDDTKAAAELFMAERSAAASRERELSEATKVFWGEPTTAEGTASRCAVLAASEDSSDPVVEQLRGVQDSSTLLALLATGILDAANIESLPAIADWLFRLVFTTESQDLVWTSVNQLQQIMEASPHEAFITSERMYERIQSVWTALGANPGPSTLEPLQGAAISLSRAETSAVICTLVSSAAQQSWLGAPELEGLVLRLFLLIADPATTTTLSQQIANAIQTALSALQPNVADLAFKAAQLVAPLPTQLQARAVLALGAGTAEVRQMVRWLSIGLILPDLRTKGEQLPSVVDMDLLQQGLERLEDLMGKETDYWSASDTFTLWSLALSEDALEDGAASGFTDATRRQLNDLLHTIPDKAQEGPAATLKGRMDQLKHVLKLQSNKIHRRRGKQTDPTGWLFGEKRSSNQTRLQFAPAKQA